MAALSCVAYITWLFLWHYEFFLLTLVAMFALLLLLIATYLRLEIGRARVSPVEKWLVPGPFSIYLGWITVATIANVTSVLDYLHWSGWGISPEAWTVIIPLNVGGESTVEKTAHGASCHVARCTVSHAHQLYDATEPNSAGATGRSSNPTRV